METRRDALRTLAAGAIVPALHGQHQHSEEVVQIAKPQAPKNLSPGDFQLIGQIADLIIPRTNTPGAVDAGVPFFVDRAITKTPALGPKIAQGLQMLRNSGFAQADHEQQVAVLARLSEQADPFFKLMKELTIDGYYSSKEGLVTELGYHGNTYLSEFKGCTHPEHQGDTHAA